jgi:hypothetical protein
MGTDALNAANYSSFRVDYDGNRTLKITLNLDSVDQKLKLGVPSKVTVDGLIGISVPATIDPMGTTPSSVTLPAIFASGSSYTFVQLAISTKRPSPLVVVRVNIP